MAVSSKACGLKQRGKRNSLTPCNDVTQARHCCSKSFGMSSSQSILRAVASWKSSFPVRTMGPSKPNGSKIDAVMLSIILRVTGPLRSRWTSKKNSSVDTFHLTPRARDSASGLKSRTSLALHISGTSDNKSRWFTTNLVRLKPALCRVFGIYWIITLASATDITEARQSST